MTAIPFPKKGDLGNSKNYRSLTFTALILNGIRPLIEKNSSEKSKRLSEKSIHNFTDSDNSSNYRRSTGKKSRGNTTVGRFLQVFDCIHRGKKDQILLAYDIPRETVTAVMMLYKNMKAVVDGNSNLFVIVAKVWQRDTLASSLFILCRDYVLRVPIDLLKENSFTF